MIESKVTKSTRLRVLYLQRRSNLGTDTGPVKPEEHRHLVVRLFEQWIKFPLVETDDIPHSRQGHVTPVLFQTDPGSPKGLVENHEETRHYPWPINVVSTGSFLFRWLTDDRQKKKKGPFFSPVE